MKFKFLEHTADIKFKAYGKTIEESFKNSAFALKETICGKLKVKTKIKKEFVIESEDMVAMLYLFLEEFLYLLDAEDFLMSKVKLKIIAKSRIEVEVLGDKASNYDFTNDVKAITYSDMFVKKEKGRWTVQVVLDV